MGGPNYFLPSESAQDMLARFARPGAFPLLVNDFLVFFRDSNSRLFGYYSIYSTKT